MIEDRSEVLATSNDLHGFGHEIVIANDDNYVVILSNKRVAMYSLKTCKLVREVLEDEVVEAVWTNNPDEDCFHALTATGDKCSVVKVKIPSGKIVKASEMKAKLPETLQMIRASFAHDGPVDRLYYVTKQSGTHSISSFSCESSKSLQIGQVQLNANGQALFDFNQELVVKVYRAVSGSNKKGQKVYVTSAEGSALWSQKVDRERPVTAIRCCSRNKVFATGDKSGRIRVWKDQNVFTEGHWHSLPVEALEFTLDGVHLLSGGGEGVIVKWDAKTMQKVAMVPRIGASLTRITASHGRIIASTSANTIKVFTANLEDQLGIVGLSTLKQKKMVWQPSSKCLVLIGNNQQLQFFDPMDRAQKFAVEVIRQNVVLGERDTPVAQSKVIDFDLTSLWLATLEHTWDNAQVLCLWALKDQKYVCSTRVNEPHSDKVTFMTFAPMKKAASALVTGGLDKMVKIWYLHEEASWQLLKTVSYLGLVPTCATSSQDGTVLAVAFDVAVLLFDTKTFEVLATLTSKHVMSAYTSLVFGLGSNARTLFGSTQNGIFAWDLLSLKLRGRFEASNPTLYSNGKSILLKSQEGLFAWDPAMKCSKLSPISKGIDAMAFDNANNRLYYVDHSKCNALKFLSLKPSKESFVKSTRSNEMEVDSNPLSLEFSLNKLTVNVSEDISYARLMGQINADSITQKVSHCSESIIKRALPV